MTDDRRKCPQCGKTLPTHYLKNVRAFCEEGSVANARESFEWTPDEIAAVRLSHGMSRSTRMMSDAKAAWKRNRDKVDWLKRFPTTHHHEIMH